MRTAPHDLIAAALLRPLCARSRSRRCFRSGVNNDPTGPRDGHFLRAPNRKLPTRFLPDTASKTPSIADVEMTRKVVEGARTLGIAVHDHMVVGRTDVASFKALGLI
ncbi:JAB domain-containing protein [Phenylobacterium sp.]|uniref:JAB domain-containing protein n=1 Tax=Phenylobacterium sp. TaxID=1871053 RepID=UPI00356A1D8F